MSESEREDVVARSRRLREAATPGPWQIDPDTDPCYRVRTRHYDGFGQHTHICSNWSEGNNTLIAAAPTLLAELEAEVQRLRARERTLVEGYLIGEPIKVYRLASAPGKPFRQRYRDPKYGDCSGVGATAEEARATAIRNVLEALGLEDAP